MKISGRRLLTVFLSTFKIGLFTFGGGLAMLPFIEAEFCAKRGWLTIDELADVTAAAQTLPGIVAVNTSLLACYRVGGAITALIGALGAVLPSFIVLSIVTVFYNNVIDNAYIQGALRGVSGAVAAMFVNTLLRMRKQSLSDWWAFGFFAVALTLIFVFPDLNVIFIILGGGVIGFVLRMLILGKRANVRSADDSGNDDDNAGGND
jgi:chromate transporter